MAEGRKGETTWFRQKELVWRMDGGATSIMSPPRGTREVVSYIFRWWEWDWGGEREEGT